MIDIENWNSKSAWMLVSLVLSLQYLFSSTLLNLVCWLSGFNLSSFNVWWLDWDLLTNVFHFLIFPSVQRKRMSSNSWDLLLFQTFIGQVELNIWKILIIKKTLKSSRKHFYYFLIYKTGKLLRCLWLVVFESISGGLESNKWNNCS